MLHRRFANATQVSLWCKSDNRRPVSASEMNFDCATAGPASGFQALPAVTVLLLAIPFEMSVPCCPALGKLIPLTLMILYLSVATADESPVAVTYYSIIHQMWQRHPRHVEAADHYVEALRFFSVAKAAGGFISKIAVVCNKAVFHQPSSKLISLQQNYYMHRELQLLDYHLRRWCRWWRWWCTVQEVLKLGISITKRIQELRHPRVQWCFRKWGQFSF